MKKLIMLAFAAFFGLNVMAQKYSDSTNIIGEGHIGKVVINMNETRLASVFDASQIKSDKKSSEGDEYSVIHVTLPGEAKPALEIETMCMDICEVSRVTVFSPVYKTVKGIGVNSSVSDLKKNYTLTTVVGGEDGIMIYIDEIPQTAFIVAVPGLKVSPGKPVKAEAIPGDTKILRVYMY